MATLVKFLKHKDDVNGTDIYAYFPQLNFNERLYGNQQKQSFSSEGHSGCHVDYAAESELASYEEYKDLLSTMINAGYNDLNVLNEVNNQRHFENTYNAVYEKLMKEEPDFDKFTEKLSNWIKINAPKFGVKA